MSTSSRTRPAIATGTGHGASAQPVLAAALLLSAGALSDRIGAWRAFGAGVLGFVAASAACGLRVGEQLFVRSWQGQAGAWYRHARQRPDGRIRAGGTEYDIIFQTPQPAPDGKIDRVYQSNTPGTATPTSEP